MSTAASIPIINAALTRTGDEPITSFDEGTTQAAVASANYDEIVNAILSGYPWKFCSRQFELSHVDAVPDLPWTHAYQMPADVLDLRVVESQGAPINYEVMSDKILTMWEPPILAKYTYRLSEEFWPKYFRGAVIAAFEPIFLRAIGERYDEALNRDKRAINLLAVARNRDAQSQTPRQPMDSPILRARGGIFPSTLRGTRIRWNDPFR